ncbi:MAG: diaminopimelate decarboxylase [Sediminibacterium sp.]
MKRQLLSIAGQFGTPCYCYDFDVIREKYRSLMAAFPEQDLTVYYAMKANSNPHILALLSELGACIDAVSLGEVLLALQVGFQKEKIMFTANNITLDEMDEVAALGVTFNIGSLSELRKFGKTYPGYPVCLRINPGIVAGSHGNIQTGGDLTKFGILLMDVPKACQIAVKYRLPIIGLHKHTGSGIKDLDKFLAAAERLLQLAQPEQFPDLQFVDFGGGLYVAYKPDEEAFPFDLFVEGINAKVSECSKRYGRKIKLFFEPGKYLVAESGYLLIEVTNLKQNNGRLIAGTNSGFPQLIRPVFYQAYHHIVNLTNSTGKYKVYDICGNICESGDNFAERRPMPEIREGDILAIENAGAYCYSMGGVYNLHPMPPEIMIDGGKVALIRQGMSVKELISSILKQSGHEKHFVC